MNSSALAMSAPRRTTDGQPRRASSHRQHRGGSTRRRPLSSGFNVGDTNHDGLLENGEPGCYRRGHGHRWPGCTATRRTAVGTPSEPTATRSGASQQTASRPGQLLRLHDDINIVKLTNSTDNDNAALCLYVPVGTVDLDLRRNERHRATCRSSIRHVTNNIAASNPTPGPSGSYNVGDTNQDGLLEAGETSVFTASAARPSPASTATSAQPSDAQATTPAANRSRGPPSTASRTGRLLRRTTTSTSCQADQRPDNDGNAPGLYVPVGSPVTWTYDVTTTGNVPLSSVNVSDNIAGVDPTRSSPAAATTSATRTRTACWKRARPGLHRQRHAHCRPVQQIGTAVGTPSDANGNPIPVFPSKRRATRTTTTATRPTSTSSS